MYVCICLFTIAKLYNNAVHLHFGDSPASEFYIPTFRNTVSSIFTGGVNTPPVKMEQSVPKRQHVKFRSRKITQK